MKGSYFRSLNETLFQLIGTTLRFRLYLSKYRFNIFCLRLSTLSARMEIAAKVMRQDFSPPHRSLTSSQFI
ncbi:MAG: hypothetical protein AUJ04_04060 [Acidobacteria bacterium 13_1_40CM_3_55_6]|nr:MAG: hypothetical protein AUJ04_04060 [Acidobacteria bacterium 13_1_40CM_3_55_6]